MQRSSALTLQHHAGAPATGDQLAALVVTLVQEFDDAAIKVLEATKDRKAKIMDFGLAKVIEEVRNHTTVVSGTPFYMSPEQTLGKNVDQRSDLYSLGVSVFEMATGTLPFTEGNLPYHHVHTPPPRPQDLEPDLPDLLAGVIERCLRKDPEERYQSAREILAELRSASPL